MYCQIFRKNVNFGYGTERFIKKAENDEKCSAKYIKLKIFKNLLLDLSKKNVVSS